MDANKLKEIVERHGHWLREDCDGWESMRADLRGAYLSRADLREAYLRGADLSRADLIGAKIENDILNKYVPIACPDSGAFIGWKKCRKDTLVKLEILADAKRSSAFGRKCRCSAAKVLEITDADGNQITETVSCRDFGFIYRTGEIVSVDDFDEDRKNECSTGIHFFITRQEAVDYDA